MAASTPPPASFTLLSLAILFFSSCAARRLASTDLVTTLCNAAPYQDLCLQSMSLFPPTITRNPTKLARAAIALSLDSAKAASTYLLGTAANAGVLQECVEDVGDAVDLLLQSVGELDRLGRQRNADYGLHVGNVQVWAAAAIVDASSCLNSLSDAPADDGKMVKGVKKMMTHAFQMTSNALVFVNNIAPTV